MDIVIQASIAGFEGKACTILAKYSADAGVVTIAAEKPFTRDRLAKEVAMISNLDIPDRDWFFGEDALGVAISAYFEAKGQGEVIVVDALNRYLPDNKIEKDTVDEKGRNFRIAPEVENGQVAILAIVAYVRKNKSTNAAIDMMDEMADFYGVTTI
jgi:hypothetical protein